MKKRFIALGITLFMLFLLVACNSPNKLEVGFDGGKGAAEKYNDFLWGKEQYRYFLCRRY